MWAPGPSTTPSETSATTPPGTGPPAAPPIAGWPPPPAPQRPPLFRAAGVGGSGPRVPSIVSFRRIEEQLTGRALAWVGGIALVLGAIFFLSLAFSRGWIGPELRVIAGVVFGVGCLALGAWLLDRGDRLVGHVVTPAGLAIVSISMVAATGLYGMLPVAGGLAVVLASAVAAAVIALRWESQVVAAFGLIAVLVAPPLMNAPPDSTTFLVIGAALIGTTAIGSWRTWSWLPPLAFALSAPQVAWWILGRPDTSIVLAGLAGYWLINVVAAGGEAFRRHRPDVSPSSATLLLADAAFLVWGGFQVLSGGLEGERGLFLLVVGAAHLAIGLAFVARDGERGLFGLLVLGTGVAAITMAAPVQLGASAVPVAWTAEAVVLAAIAFRRRHGYSAGAAAVLFILAGLAVIRSALLVLDDDGRVLDPGVLGALAFFAAGSTLAVWIVPDRDLRSALGALVLAVAAVTFGILATPSMLVIALVGLAVLGLALDRWLDDAPVSTERWEAAPWLARLRLASAARTTAVLTTSLSATAWSIAGLGTALLVTAVYGSRHDLSGTPFLDEAGLALGAYLIGVVVAGWLADARLRSPLAAVSLLVVAWACVQVLDGAVLGGALAALVVIGAVLARSLPLLSARPARAPWSLGVAFDRTWTSESLLPLGAVMVATLGYLIALLEMPGPDLERGFTPWRLSSDDGASAALALIAGVLVAGHITGGTGRRTAEQASIAMTALVVAIYAAGWEAAIGWVGLALIALGRARSERQGREVLEGTAAILVASAAALVLGAVAPLDDVLLGESTGNLANAMTSWLAIGAVIGGALALTRATNPPWLPLVARIAAGVAAVYLASAIVVDVIALGFATRVGRTELRTQSQVGLSITWSLLGVGAFVVGIRRASESLRLLGLALLALATAKVFLFDLAALDVAYRAMSLLVLGVVLLSGAWWWQRQRRRPDPAAPGDDSAGAAPLHGPESP